MLNLLLNMEHRAKRHKFDPEALQKAMLNTIIINQLPFSVVEQDDIKKVMEHEFPGFQIPSTETVSSVCARLFVDEKLKLKSFMKSTNQKVCLSLDTWKSNQSVSFLCITAHFIDDGWNLHKKIIGFSPVCSDNGEEIGKVVEKCLHDWEIYNVLTISAGSASSYDVVISYLRTRLGNQVLDGKYLRLKCLVEFINTMVKEVLVDYDEVITRVRAKVRYVLESPTRIKNFKKCARELGIKYKSIFSLDSPSSWTSTYEMLDMTDNICDVFNLFEDKHPKYKHDMSKTSRGLDCDDWGRVMSVVFFLSVFYQSAEKVLRLHVTSNIFFDEMASIDYHLDEWTKSWKGNEERFFEACDLQSKHIAYWGGIEDSEMFKVEDSNMLIYIAGILDPRHKTDCMENYFKQCRYKHHYDDKGEPWWKMKAESVAGVFYDLFNEYAVKIHASHQTASLQTSAYMTYLHHVECPRAWWGQDRDVGFEVNVEGATEIDIYLGQDECFEKDWYEKFDVLVWWKDNSEKFPVLSKMAKDVLAIPISAVALESAFNTDNNGNLLDDFRSSLSPSMVEALVCTQYWIPKSKKHVKVKGGSNKLDDKFLKGIYEQLGAATSRYC